MQTKRKSSPIIIKNRSTTRRQHNNKNYLFQQPILSSNVLHGSNGLQRRNPPHPRTKQQNWATSRTTSKQQPIPLRRPRQNSTRHSPFTNLHINIYLPCKRMEEVLRRIWNVPLTPSLLPSRVFLPNNFNTFRFNSLLLVFRRWARIFSLGNIVRDIKLNCWLCNDYAYFYTCWWMDDYL